MEPLAGRNTLREEIPVKAADRPRTTREKRNYTRSSDAPKQNKHE